MTNGQLDEWWLRPTGRPSDVPTEVRSSDGLGCTAVPALEALNMFNVSLTANC